MILSKSVEIHNPQILLRRPRHDLVKFVAQGLRLDLGEFLGLLLQRLGEVVEGGDHFLGDLVDGGDVHRRGKAVIRRLAVIDLVVGMDRLLVAALVGAVALNLTAVTVPWLSPAALDGVADALQVPRLPPSAIPPRRAPRR